MPGIGSEEHHEMVRAENKRLKSLRKAADADPCPLPQTTVEDSIRRLTHEIGTGRCRRLDTIETHIREIVRTAEANCGGQLAELRARAARLLGGAGGDPIGRQEVLGFLADVAATHVTLPLILHCPRCRVKHVDKDEWATRPHKTHLCEGCGYEWQPARFYSVGVEVLP